MKREDFEHIAIDGSDLVAVIMPKAAAQAIRTIAGDCYGSVRDNDSNASIHYLYNLLADIYGRSKDVPVATLMSAEGGTREQAFTWTFKKG